MASAATVSSSERFLADLSSSFEFKVKRCLAWSKQEWVSAGLNNSMFFTLVASLKYWNAQLEEAMGPNNVVLTLFSVHRQAFIDLDDIVDAIQALGPHIVITGYSSLENKRYLSIELQSEEMKMEVIRRLKVVGEAHAVFLNWVSQNTTINFHVQWLPKHLSSDRVSVCFEPFVDIVEVAKLNTVSRMGKVLPSGDMNVKAKLKKGVLLSDVPHVIYVGKLKGLVSAPGRDPLCLTCRKVGHLAFECPTPFCRTCRKLMPQKHLCGGIGKSYAATLKKDRPTIEDGIVSHSWGDWEQVDPPPPPPRLSTFLSGDRSAEGSFDTNVETSEKDLLLNAGSFAHNFVKVNEKTFPSLPTTAKSVLEKAEINSQCFKEKEEKQENDSVGLNSADESLPPGQGDKNASSEESESMDFETVRNKRKINAISSSNSETEVVVGSSLKGPRGLNTYGKSMFSAVPTQNLFDSLGLGNQESDDDAKLF